ncbi:NUC1 [Acrasis kona]|uniref:NUC1 n=1 Tax=Acrasis kona TaxID=1008807 RepID=A0AAW2YK60_9EUKA
MLGDDKGDDMPLDGRAPIIPLNDLVGMFKLIRNSHASLTNETWMNENAENKEIVKNQDIPVEHGIPLKSEIPTAVKILLKNQVELYVDRKHESKTSDLHEKVLEKFKTSQMEPEENYNFNYYVNTLIQRNAQDLFSKTKST